MKNFKTPRELFDWLRKEYGIEWQMINDREYLIVLPESIKKQPIKDKFFDDMPIAGVI